MKKIYALLALATSMSAFAGTHLADKAEKATFNVKDAQLQEYTILNKESNKRNAPAAQAPILYNYSAYVYYGLTSSDNDQQIQACEFKQYESNEVWIYGLACPLIDYPVKGYYDAEEQSITLNTNQVVCPAENWDGENDLLFGCAMINMDTGELDPIDSITLYYAPDGVQFNNGTVAYPGCWVSGNGYAVMLFNTDLTSMSGWKGSWKYNNIMPAIGDIYTKAPSFKFEPTEWEYIGDAQFTDGWLNSYVQMYFAEDPVEAYPVRTYQNYNDHNQVLLMNPYGKNTPYEDINGSANEQGFIILDVTNPDCVVVRPNIRSGFSLLESWWYFTAADFTMTNIAGMSYYIDEVDYEDIIADAEKWGDTLPTMTEDYLVSLPDCRVQRLEDFYVPTQFDDDMGFGGNLLEMSGQIQLPNLSGINHVITDQNVPARYFNLQGVEISKPAAGEIVIVKEGNKAKKVVF